MQRYIDIYKPGYTDMPNPKPGHCYFLILNRFIFNLYNALAI